MGKYILMKTYGFELVPGWCRGGFNMNNYMKTLNSLASSELRFVILENKCLVNTHYSKYWYLRNSRVPLDLHACGLTNML